MSIFNFEKPARRVAWLVAVYVICWFNAFEPFVRFSISPLNYLFFAVVQIIPWVVCAASFNWPGWRRWGLFSISLALAIVGAPFGLISTGCAVTTAAALGVDRSFERILTVPTSRGTVAVYKTDEGALGFGSIFVRQQCTLVPGILVIHELAYKDTAYEARVEKIDASSVRVTIPPAYKDSTDQTTDRTVKLVLLPCVWSRAG